MKFESKYIIRWGIPGWVFIMWLLLAFIIVNPLFFKDLLFKDLLKSLGTLVTLASIGVPVGYVISQFYFAFSWVIGKDLDMTSLLKKVENFPYPRNWEDDKKEQYFFIEYLWESKLGSLSTEKREYIAGRYSHFLRTIHGIGTLFYSSLFSLFVFILFIVNVKFELYYLFLITIQVVFLYFIYKNYKYYSENLKSFQGYFLNEFINSKVDTKGENDY
ncbi:hypothetical protein COJ01_19945 [Priestia megaterium]|uniref:hypothetical protein n=1 Tax=Priestia megaterium TaxID=1404 RepID=UPI000BF6711F|nr:hypothetical protein [Priestia megaterium]PFK99263.1 hypothetical protein COJ01_19945 [Priestia megaterium]